MCDSEYEFYTKNYLYLYELTHSKSFYFFSFYNNYLVSWCRHERVIDLYVNNFTLILCFGNY